ncbi:hypothetical protein Q9Q99_13250 [Curtobacterium flaccumfaciens]|nr:hypothetical protein Q9Q99_13250 [Curtobacterium flaccumfaciens]
MNTVGDLLPLLPAGTRLLVGPGSTAVRSVRGVVGTPDQVGRSLAQGDDVVVLLTPVDRADARFDVLLRRASAAGTALLVVDGSLELGPGTTTLADRLGVAVLATPDPWATSVRLHELIGTGMGPAARAALDASRVALDAGPELDDLFARLDRSLGHPVRFLDASGLALRGAAVDDTARAVLVRRAGTSDVLIAEGVDETLVAIPVGTGIGPRAWLAVGLSVPIAAEQQVVASALQVAAVAVGHRLLLTRLDDERDARYRMAMLDELRAADGAPAPQLVQRTIAAGWRLDAWHVGARVVARQGVDLVALRQQVDAAVRAEGLGRGRRRTGGRLGAVAVGTRRTRPGGSGRHRESAAARAEHAPHHRGDQRGRRQSAGGPCRAGPDARRGRRRRPPGRQPSGVGALRARRPARARAAAARVDADGHVPAGLTAVARTARNAVAGRS